MTVYRPHHEEPVPRSHCNKQVSLGRLQDIGQNGEKKNVFLQISNEQLKMYKIFTTMKNKQTNMKFNTYMICSKLPNTEEMRERLKQTARSLCPQTVRSAHPYQTHDPQSGRGQGGHWHSLSPKAVRLLDSRLFPGTSKPKLTIQRYIASPIWHN